jgi:electron transfer flavoprotein alpha subunit
MSPGVIVFSEADEGIFELLTKGRELSKLYNTQLSALVIGKKDEKEIDKFFQYGAEKILFWPNEKVPTFETDAYVHALFEVTKQDGPDILLIRSSRLGKEVAGRIAQRLQAGCVTDAIGLRPEGSELVVDRYALGGNTISSEIIKTNKKVVSVMPRTFEAQPTPVTGKVERLALEKPPERVELVERRKKVGESANIESAENLVCVGKGLASKEDLSMVNELCSLLKAELGCTRALSADYHWISEDRMVGISGKRCKPRLDVSIGISGQIQHTVGIMSARIIVAINKDKEAPIFKIADYGIVGDLYQVVPKLIQRIKAQNS